MSGAKNKTGNKSKTRQWDYTKLKSSAQQTEQSLERKNNHTEQQKISINHATDKGPTARIYLEFKQINSKEKNATLKYRQ